MRKLIIFAFIAVMLSGIAGAAPPVIGNEIHEFYGAITGAPAGTVITAKISGATAATYTTRVADSFGCLNCIGNSSTPAFTVPGSTGNIINFTASGGTLSTPTEYTFAGGNKTKLNFTYTADAGGSTTGGTGGGGGGGGGAGTIETVVFGTVTAGIPITQKYSKAADHAVSSITIEPKTTKDKVEVKVESTGKPTEAKAVIASEEGGVYKYIKITPKIITDADVSKVTYTFRVPLSWYSTNGYDKPTTEILLYNPATTEWEKMSAAKSSEDSEAAYWSFERQGFSIYAIAAKKAAAAKPAEQAKKEEPKEAAETKKEGIAAAIGSAAGEAVEAVGKAISAMPRWFVIAILLIVAAIIIAIAYARHKKGKL